MTPAEEKLAWDRHRCAQLRQWRDPPFRQKLQALEEMGRLAARISPIPAPAPQASVPKINSLGDASS